jgi:hypothetical protein
MNTLRNMENFILCGQRNGYRQFSCVCVKCWANILKLGLLVLSPYRNHLFTTAPNILNNYSAILKNESVVVLGILRTNIRVIHQRMVI